MSLTDRDASRAKPEIGASFTPLMSVNPELPHEIQMCREICVQIATNRGLSEIKE
jgi:hypothetical protein